MPTLTLKNIPDDLHAQLKASAARNRRSLNSEILLRLEQDISRPVLDPVVHAETLRAFAARLPAEPLATRQAWTNHLQSSAMPVLLVSDASVLIDLQRGGILEMVFRLPFEVGVCCGFSMHSRSTPAA